MGEVMARQIKCKWGISPNSKELRPHIPEERKSRTDIHFKFQSHRHFHSDYIISKMREEVRQIRLRRKKVRRIYGIMIGAAISVIFAVVLTLLFMKFLK